MLATGSGGSSRQTNPRPGQSSAPGRTCGRAGWHRRRRLGSGQIERTD